ncbi:hypothetical protein F5887DRAFT_921841 [Amanita rubescens]|nr:hypothetical protein F5887DRAFT_921841 [Amanita rubescens]
MCTRVQSNEQGSFFVTRRAQTFLAEKLRRSTFGTKRDIEVMTRYFDGVTQPNFREPSKPYFIRFGRNENDPEHDIRSGNIKLSGIDIAKFFEPTIKNIIKAIDEQTRMTATRIRAIFMVGRFSTSDYLFSKLEDHFKSRGIDILRLETYINKTVAEGAMIFKIESFVSSEPQRRLTKNDFDRLQEEYNRELRAAQDELQALREQRDTLKKLVDTQAVELTAAREFTFITDQVSATDLISIEQPAPPTALPASAADMERLQVQARIYSVSVIGERLLHLAQSVGQEDKSFPILAFQSGIIHVCFSAISSWVFGRGHEPQHGILNIAYEQIWASVQREIYTLLSHLLICIGWKVETRQIKALLEELSVCINEIATFVAKTSKMIREEFVSDDLQVTYVRAGQHFNPSLMDAEGQASPGVQAPVLCTAELGLALQNRAGGQRMLLKPRVALDTHAS